MKSGCERGGILGMGGGGGVQFSSSCLMSSEATLGGVGLMTGTGRETTQSKVVLKVGWSPFRVVWLSLQVSLSPVNQFGLAVSRGTLVQYCFGSPFSSKRLWFVDTVSWLCPSLPTETLKWLSSLPILMQESFWWWQCSDRYITSLSLHLHTPFPPPFSPSLISLMVTADVKHHVYLLTYPWKRSLSHSTPVSDNSGKKPMPAMLTVSPVLMSPISSILT